MDRESHRTSLAVLGLLLACLYVSSGKFTRVRVKRGLFTFPTALAADCALPEITGDSVVSEGDSLFLECSCNGSSWTLNGQSLPGDAVVDVSSGSVTVGNAEHSVHAGGYVCTVDGISSAVFQVTVQCKS